MAALIYKALKLITAHTVAGGCSTKPVVIDRVGLITCGGCSA